MNFFLTSYFQIFINYFMFNLQKIAKKYEISQ